MEGKREEEEKKGGMKAERERETGRTKERVRDRGEREGGRGSRETTSVVSSVNCNLSCCHAKK